MTESRIAASIIADSIIAADPVAPGPQTRAAIAAQVLVDLEAAGFVLMAPQDIEWGTCDRSDDGTHRVALNLCTWCLEYDPA